MTQLASPRRTTSRRQGVLWAGFAVILSALNLRTAVTGFTPLLEMIGSELGFGLAIAGLLGAVPAASFAFFGFFAPRVTNRFGMEQTAAAALGLTTFALVGRALSPDTSLLFISTVLALAGIGAVNVVIVPLVKAWFAHRLAVWTSLYLLLMQAGQFLAPLIAVPVAEDTSWRVSLIVWAAPAALASIAWLLVTLRLPPTRHARTDVSKRHAVSVGRSGTVWGLVVLFAMMAVSNYGIITWVPAVLTDAGASAATGGTMVAIYSVWGVAAAIVIPQLATRLRNPFAVVAVCAVFLIGGYVGLAVAPLAATIVWICALGIGVSTFPLCMTLINQRTTNLQTASSVSGFVQGIGYAVACAAPVTLGVLREASGSWFIPLILLAASAIPGAVAGWFACRPGLVEDSLPSTRPGTSGSGR